MGIYLNPGNSGFTAIRNSRYVDKSGMILVGIAYNKDAPPGERKHRCVIEIYQIGL